MDDNRGRLLGERVVLLELCRKLAAQLPDGATRDVALDTLAKVEVPDLHRPGANEPDLGQRLEQDRATLVAGCLELSDLAPEDPVRELVAVALARVGVVPVTGEGEVFDPRRHRAIGRVVTTDAALHRRVAATQRPGYLDHGQLLRPPMVSVYRLPEQPHAR
jgi:hypothetical protein